MILEDDGLLSLMLEDLAREQGATTIHACRDPEEALRLASAGSIDYAVLDVWLHGRVTYDVADALAARDIPFLFCTGLTSADIAARHRHRPLLQKPYGDADFKAVLAVTLNR
ncbi:MAG TPA: hypothetical protein VL418_00195 [Devosiaceae bacterium]|nr:hypothetical protein [Devosiaceae bacterium]